jgi:hypothetical protein
VRSILNNPYWHCMVLVIRNSAHSILNDPYWHYIVRSILNDPYWHCIVRSILNDLYWHCIVRIAGCRITPVLVFWTDLPLHWEFLRLWTGLSSPAHGAPPSLLCIWRFNESKWFGFYEVNSH